MVARAPDPRLARRDRDRRLDRPPRNHRKAAALAAWNSKGKDSGKVDVDYTLIRYVKKIPNGPPGLVNYTHQKTIAAIPTEIKDE